MICLIAYEDTSPVYIVNVLQMYNLVKTISHKQETTQVEVQV